MSTSASARRAALLLHAMQPADQQWLLAALPAQQGRALRDMLDELEALGIPADSALLQSLADAAEPTPTERFARLETGELQWLARCLQEEGPEFAGRLLAGQAWRDALLAHCHQDFRSRAVAAMQGEPGALLRQAMCDAALHALAERPTDAASRGRRWHLPWRRSA